MRAPPDCTSPRDVIAALDFVDPERTAAARLDATQRPIAYALGSGEADEVALYAGLKPLIRQVLPTAELAAARARFEALGLLVGEAEHRVALPSTEGTVLFVGRDPRRVHEAVLCEAAPDHDLELGRLLGYPRCCVEAYLDVPPPRRNVEAFARAADASGGVFAPRLNTVDLAVFHYFTWLPCSFACPVSKAFADAVANHIAKRHGQFLAITPHGQREGGGPSRVTVKAARSTCPPGCRHERFVAAIDEALAAHRLLVLEDVQISIAGTFDGRELRVARVWPTARDRHPDAQLDDGVREAVARLVASIGAARAIAVEAGALFVDGEPVLRGNDVRLFPFG